MFIPKNLSFIWNLQNDTTLFSFPVLFQFSEFSNYIFNFIIYFIHFTIEDKYIPKFGSSNGEILE